MKDPMMGEMAMGEFLKNIDLAIEHFQDMVRLGEARKPKDSMLAANSLALRALKDLKFGSTLSDGRIFLFPDETEILEKYADKPIPTKELHDIARAISLAKNINLENRMLRGMADEYVRLMAQKICQDQTSENPDD